MRKNIVSKFIKDKRVNLSFELIKDKSDLFTRESIKKALNNPACALVSAKLVTPPSAAFSNNHHNMFWHDLDDF